jgi:hypothetical protein
MALGLTTSLALAAGPLPEEVVVHDSRTSPPAVDISEVGLQASWYWDSEQIVSVTVPHGWRTGHRLTVWFDIDGDDTPEGHFTLVVGESVKPGSTKLRKAQQFRVGGGWSHGGRPARSCSDSEGFAPVSEVRRGQQDLFVALDLWGCLGADSPAGEASGAWRAAVRLTRGQQSDMAPSGRRWSRPVAGWGPCDPSGGSCG